MKECIKELQNRLVEQKIMLDCAVFERLEVFSLELLKWNKIHNLSGASSIESVAENLFDSIYPLKFIEDFASCLDIGSGGGFPAIALSIAKANVKFFLIEPRLKRAAFLQHISLKLNLNVKVFTISIQQVPITEVNNISLITSRAAMDAQMLMALSRKFLSREGYFLLYKGKRFKDEMPYLSVEECFLREQRIYYYKRGYEV